MTPIDPSEYDRWYQTPRGRWIGDLEYSLIRNTLKQRSEDSVLDVGCGTGHFTRSFALHHEGKVAGIDPEPAFIEYASTQAIAHESYLLGEGENLPIESNSFDYAVSITALCFVDDQIRFLQEMDRVSRKGMAVGLLNRNSILWHQKGEGGRKSAYTGAHWHSRKEVEDLFRAAGLPMPIIKTAVSFPSGRFFTKLFEHLVPDLLPWGGFLLAALKRTSRRGLEHSDYYNWLVWDGTGH